MPYPRVRTGEVRHVIGDRLAEHIPVEAIVDELTTRYDVYFIMPEGAAHAGDRQVLDRWRGLLGQNVIQLDDLDAVCETIALTVGLGEDAIDLDEGLDDLRDSGSPAGTSVSRALAVIGANHSGAPSSARTRGVLQL